MNHSLPAFSCACSHYLFRFLSFGGVLAEDILQFVHIAGGGLKLAQNLSHGHCLRRLELLNLKNNPRFGFKIYEEERVLNLSLAYLFHQRLVLVLNGVKRLQGLGDFRSQFGFVFFL